MTKVHDLKYQIRKNKVKSYIVTDKKSVTTTNKIFSDQALVRLDSESSFSVSKKEK